MKIGLQQVFQNHHREVDDGQMIAEEIELGLLAEALGLDEIWPVEHHFTQSFCPGINLFASPRS
jgi:alkanesulfonate monooxygenase SsuD/methylene tetrahydromethanopterin reductase-like flavin-dependent oxidoreductase (luciferase family)